MPEWLAIVLALALALAAFGVINLRGAFLEIGKRLDRELEISQGLLDRVKLAEPFRYYSRDPEAWGHQGNASDAIAMVAALQKIAGTEPAPSKQD